MRISEKDFKAMQNKKPGGAYKPPAPKESDIQRDIKSYLEIHGWFVVKIHQSLGSYKGIADLFALKDGQAVWIEVKTPKGTLSEYQEQFRDDITRCGGRYMVARSVDDVLGIIK